jgi:hypothetical protein
MIHPLCRKCLNKCKQEDTVKIVKCPSFQKRFSDGEFKELVYELDEIQTDADIIRKKAHDLIRKVLEKDEDCLNGSTSGSKNSIE